MSLTTGLLFGVLPALAASDERLAVSLNEESRGGAGSVRAKRLRAALVVAELALSLVLLAGASLLVVSFNNLLNVSPGFQPAQLVIARVTLPSTRYGEHERVVAFFDALFEQLAAAPGDSARRRDDVVAVRRCRLAPQPDDRAPNGASRRFRCACTRAWSRPATFGRWASR